MAHKEDFLVVFGAGTDIYVADNCNNNFSSGSNLGGTFTLPPGVKFESEEARTYLAGSYKFKVSEIETYLVVKT